MTEMEEKIERLEKELSDCENEMRYLERYYDSIKIEIRNCDDENRIDELEEELDIILDNMTDLQTELMILIMTLTS